MSQKPSIPKGTRDFLPSEMIKRNNILSTIRIVFESYGFQPIETPAMENLNTLMGKYGEEGDKLLFKILNSGEFRSGISDMDYTDWDAPKLAAAFCEKGLRYDLTVPFARFVVQHRNDITFPFKRYQIQPVWRADRPQKGRYREFFQCDVDVVGSNSLLNEVELIQIADEVFRKLNINVLIKLNNRKILSGIAEVIGFPDKIIDITVAIDKLDKIGIEKVIDELLEKGLSREAIEKLKPILDLSGPTETKLNKIYSVLVNSDTGKKGVKELENIFTYLDKFNLKNKVEIDLTLARGLNYYTGAIFEVKAVDVEIGSITGGGRYDNLTGIFGLSDVSGVGISFGADRIYDVLTSLNGFPENTSTITKVLFTNFGSTEELYALPLLSKVRKAGINAEIFPESSKLKKQMNYADKNKIPFVVLVGEEEMHAGKITMKDMSSGEQIMVSVEELIKRVNN